MFYVVRLFLIPFLCFPPRQEEQTVSPLVTSSSSNLAILFTEFMYFYLIGKKVFYCRCETLNSASQGIQLNLKIRE